jgi:hypothetical protein
LTTPGRWSQPAVINRQANGEVRSQAHIFKLMGVLRERGWVRGDRKAL